MPNDEPVIGYPLSVNRGSRRRVCLVSLVLWRYSPVPPITVHRLPITGSPFLLDHFFHDLSGPFQVGTRIEIPFVYLPFDLLA